MNGLSVYPDCLRWTKDHATAAFSGDRTCESEMPKPVGNHNWGNHHGHAFSNALMRGTEIQSQQKLM